MDPRVHAALAQLVHDMAYRQMFVNVLSGVPRPSGFTAWLPLAITWAASGMPAVRPGRLLGHARRWCDLRRLEPRRHPERLNMGRRVM
jgi:hypothetical protein